MHHRNNKDSSGKKANHRLIAFRFTFSFENGQQTKIISIYKHGSPAHPLIYIKRLITSVAQVQDVYKSCKRREKIQMVGFRAHRDSILFLCTTHATCAVTGPISSAASATHTDPKGGGQGVTPAA